MFIDLKDRVLCMHCSFVKHWRFREGAHFCCRLTFTCHESNSRVKELGRCCSGPGRGLYLFYSRVP